MEFQVRYLAFFHLFSEIDNFGWRYMGSLHKNIQLMREFLNAPFFVLHFSYDTSMNFLMMVSVIFLSMLTILLSTLSVMMNLMYGNNWIYLLNLNLICETLWTGARSGLLISMLEKLDWFLLKVRLNYATTNHLLPPPITSQNISTTTHKHPKMGYHLLKTKIYSYITSFWHFNSFFFCKMHYSFPWRRSCMLSFDQFVFQIQYFYDILHI